MSGWPSKRGPLTEIRPSDGYKGDAVPLAVGKWNDFDEFGCLSVESPVKILLLSIFLVFFNAAIWSLGWLYVPDISGENHGMENVQAASLLLGSIIFLIASYRASEKPSRILFISLGLFYMNFFLLEIDLRNVENYDLLLIGINPPGRDYC